MLTPLTKVYPVSTSLILPLVLLSKGSSALIPVGQATLKCNLKNSTLPPLSSAAGSVSMSHHCYSIPYAARCRCWQVKLLLGGGSDSISHDSAKHMRFNLLECRQSVIRTEQCVSCLASSIFLSLPDHCLGTTSSTTPRDRKDRPSFVCKMENSY